MKMTARICVLMLSGALATTACAATSDAAAESKVVAAVPAGMTSAAAAKGAASWPCYRGKNQDSISTEALDTHWPDGGPKRLWSAQIWFGYASLAIAGNRAYTTGSNGNGSETCVYCLNLDTGAEIWKTKLPVGKGTGWHGYGSEATPVFDDKRVYAITPMGVTAAVDIETGKLVWSYDQVEHGVGKNHYGFAASPLLYKDLIIMNCGIALKAATGEIAWQEKNVTNPWFSTPFLLSQDGKDTVIMNSFPPGKNRLFGINPLTGEELWTFELSGWPHGNWQGVSDILRISNDQIFYGNGALLKIANNTCSVVNDKLPYSNTYLGNPVFCNGHVFGFSVISGDPPKAADLAASRLQCLDLKTGKQSWQKTGMAGTCSIADGKLLIMTAEGKLIVAETSGEAYKEIVSAKIYESNMTPDGKTMSGRDGAWIMPILVNGRIYCRNIRNGMSEIVCLDVKQAEK